MVHRPNTPSGLLWERLEVLYENLSASLASFMLKLLKSLLEGNILCHVFSPYCCAFFSDSLLFDSHWGICECLMELSLKRKYANTQSVCSLSSSSCWPVKNPPKLWTFSNPSRAVLVHVKLSDYDEKLICSKMNMPGMWTGNNPLVKGVPGREWQPAQSYLPENSMDEREDPQWLRPLKIYKVGWRCDVSYTAIGGLLRLWRRRSQVDFGCLLSLEALFSISIPSSMASTSKYLFDF